MIQPSSSIDIEVFSDADWARDIFDKRSQGGFLVYYGNNLISWQLKKQGTFAQSSTEAEYKSLADVALEVLWLQKVLTELGVSYSWPSAL